MLGWDVELGELAMGGSPMQGCCLGTPQPCHPQGLLVCKQFCSAFPVAECCRRHPRAEAEPCVSVGTEQGSVPRPCTCVCNAAGLTRGPRVCHTAPRVGAGADGRALSRVEQGGPVKTLRSWARGGHAANFVAGLCTEGRVEAMRPPATGQGGRSARLWDREHRRSVSTSTWR